MKTAPWDTDGPEAFPRLSGRRTDDDDPESGYNFPSSKELAKRLGVKEKHFHKVIKKQIKIDFGPEMKSIGSTNPDIGISRKGNILLMNPKTGKTINTRIPLDLYKP